MLFEFSHLIELGPKSNPVDQYILDTKQIIAGSYLIEIADDNWFRAVQTLVIQ